MLQSIGIGISNLELKAGVTNCEFADRIGPMTVTWPWLLVHMSQNLISEYNLIIIINGLEINLAH